MGAENICNSYVKEASMARYKNISSNLSTILNASLVATQWHRVYSDSTPAATRLRKEYPVKEPRTSNNYFHRTQSAKILTRIASMSKDLKMMDEMKLPLLP